jgi:diaminohydroxyphosphoribosylaminopyrimidine deaminase/5-amino-6-(5-phosphoribosylamino)uracil reductase
VKVPADDAAYMRRAIRLAARGRGRVHPNPMVGAVIVARGTVVGEGHHPVFGGPHAESVAIEQAGAAARGATLYVNLEPCCHHGKTPPCVDAILASGIARVVAATLDPNPLVAGGGVERLRAAGVEVRVGVREAAARHLNAGYLSFEERGRPLVSLKVAATLDGKIAATGGASRWITSEPARRLVHRLRAGVDAAVVGRATVERDDPALTVREVVGRNPTRVVLDSRGRLRPDRRLFRDGEARTIHVTLPDARGVGEHWEVPPAESGRPDLGAVLVRGGRLGWRHVLLEGGGEVATEALRRGIVDRLYLFTSPRVFGSHGSLPWAGDLGPSVLDGNCRFRLHATRRVGPDLLCVLDAEPAGGGS